MSVKCMYKEVGGYNNSSGRKYQIGASGVGSTYCLVLHTTVSRLVLFFFIGPDLIALLAPSIKHIIFTYGRKSVACVSNRSWKHNLNNFFFKKFPTESKPYTTKREVGFNLSRAHLASSWCYLIITTQSIAIFVSGSADWKKNGLKWFINKPCGAGPSGFTNHPLWRGEKGWLVIFIAPIISLILRVKSKFWNV